ncbi:hypothetical protein [Mariprofundus sp. NF]|nr:hypothetical protein [Mariprofundus sp. NF]
MFNDDIDLGKLMRSYAYMSPHIAHSELGCFMDLPYEHELDDEAKFSEEE